MREFIYMCVTAALIGFLSGFFVVLIARAINGHTLRNKGFKEAEQERKLKADEKYLNSSAPLGRSYRDYKD